MINLYIKKIGDFRKTRSQSPRWTKICLKRHALCIALRLRSVEGESACELSDVVGRNAAAMRQRGGARERRTRTHTGAGIYANLFGPVVLSAGGVTFAGSSPAFDLCPRYARSAGVALPGRSSHA